ncbi:hypothetical protein SDC9_174148 [bioreactor metagenome]|uniref:Uncharacterized protein n=1 Tax=bioreactor metagenome TaxID=1076179 RepID=A0A645GSX5_9ZZZZ
MIRMRLGIVFLSREIITFENATIMVTDKPITRAGSSFAVTASAEQIPNTCTVIGLFLLNGPRKTAFVLSDINLLIFRFLHLNFLNKLHTVQCN